MFGKSKRGHKNKNTEENKISSSLSKVTKVVADEKQQDTIVAYFVNGRKIGVVLDGKVVVTPEQRQIVMEQLKNGKITAKDLDEFLLQVMSPLQDEGVTVNGIFQDIIEDPKQKQILAVATGHDVENWRQVNEADLKHLLDKPTMGQLDYRTPVGFAVFRKKFMDGIRGQATPEQLSAYELAMDGLEEKLYGRRFDYYRQIELMTGNAVSVTASEVVAEPRLDVADEMQEIIAEEKREVRAEVVQPVATAGIAVLTPERSSEALNKVVVDGDPWVQDGVEYRLGASTLMNAGVMPVYETTVDGRGIMLSNAFQLSDGRGAVLGYVPTDAGVKLRGYYADTKTGLWHYAPETIRGGRGEGLGQIGEGYGEISTMLPAAMQADLTEIVKSQGIREVTNVNPDFLLAGTAAAYRTIQDFREALRSGQARGDFYREVDRAPVRTGWQPSGKNKNVPQLMSVNAEMAPDFSRLVQRFVTYSALAGQVVADSFSSRDGQLIWVFCSDEWGRAWLGNIEVVSPVTSTGCRRDWMDAGDLATPLYEYSTQTANYGDAADTRKGLVGMWNQYLSKIPLMQEYIAHRGAKQ